MYIIKKLCHLVARMQKIVKCLNNLLINPAKRYIRVIPVQEVRTTLFLVNFKKLLLVRIFFKRNFSIIYIILLHRLVPLIKIIRILINTKCLLYILYNNYRVI